MNYKGGLCQGGSVRKPGLGLGLAQNMSRPSRGLRLDREKALRVCIPASHSKSIEGMSNHDLNPKRIEQLYLVLKWYAREERLLRYAILVCSLSLRAPLSFEDDTFFCASFITYSPSSLVS
jgi:hypothetical protein